MKKETKESILGIVGLVLLIATIVFLVYIGIQIFSPSIESIGPNALVEVSSGSKITLSSQVTFESGQSIILQNLGTNEDIYSDKFSPPPGENFPHYVIVNPPDGVYQVTGSSPVKVYSLEPTTITVKNSVFYSVMLMFFFVFAFGLLYLFLFYLSIRIIMGKDFDSSDFSNS